MGDYRVVRTVVEDDGSDGIFYRDGERWLRERGKETRLLDIAPNLERAYEHQQLLNPDLVEDRAKFMSSDRRPDRSHRLLGRGGS